MSQKKITTTAYIGVGSNIDPEENIPKALHLLSEEVLVDGTSTFYRTRPLNNRNQPEYRNGVWRVLTGYPRSTLKNKILRNVEKVLKRIRSKDKYASRTIDLDLLLYGDGVVEDRTSPIPDPDIYQRQFIAAALFELDPFLRLPDTKTPIRDVMQRLDNEPLHPDTRLTDKLKAMLTALASRETKQAGLWRLEYDNLSGIRLSFSETVPPPVSVFMNLLENTKARPVRNILDIGCGKGRIGIHLALAEFEVTGFDAVPSAIREFRQVAKNKHLEGKVQAVVGDMNRRWKIPDDSFDCAFAITVLDNQTNRQSQNHFIGELIRTLSAQGFLVLECYNSDDGYYGELLKRSGRKSGIVTDPNNKMRFRIYSDREIMELFSPYFKLIHYQRAEWESVKYDQPYM
ncbi:MAG: 2-amino-4-hydroxy-6-hydroxymethyldihydropteridine diphosphokinase, partial [Acidobacteriota bacterium]